MSSYESLTQKLAEWFDKPLAELPDDIQELVGTEFFPMPWDKLTAGGRRSIAEQLDCQRDPATAAARQSAFEFYERIHELQTQIADWESKETPTATDKDIQERRLQELLRELEQMKSQLRQARGDKYPERKRLDEASISTPSAGDYIAYPKAMRILSEGLGATPEELAAWIFLGPSDGIAAYRNANELDPQPRFHFDSFMGEDYLSPMMACWFRDDDVAKFEPADRYITGAALIERWNHQPGIRPSAFIRAKIAESRLLDIHPTFGGTQGTHPDETGFPPIEAGLFALSEIERIEAEDGLEIISEQPAAEQEVVGAEKSGNDMPPIPGDDTCAVFRSMENLHPTEIAITIVGDTYETGLAGNNMLEITVREVTRRIAVAEFGLVDRRTGSLNQQAAVLIGLAHGAKIFRTKESHAATMKRLRAEFRNRLGVKADPFTQHSPANGWQPLFSIVDLRGRADERAKEKAEYLTKSFDQMQEQGHQFADSEAIATDEGDAADRWMEENNQSWEP